jgi:hypothetical protein
LEHVVRDEESLSAIREYVRTNPERWDQDKENPAGSGGDDVEAWVVTLADRRPVAMRPPRGGGEGDGGVAPAGRRATQASPLRARERTATAPQQQRATQATPLHPRIGHGYDLHRLQPGPGSCWAGVAVSEEFRPIAHSDGDVVLHALVDALLGAIGRAGTSGEALR